MNPIKCCTCTRKRTEVKNLPKDLTHVVPKAAETVATAFPPLQIHMKTPPAPPGSVVENDSQAINELADRALRVALVWMMEEPSNKRLLDKDGRVGATTDVELFLDNITSVKAAKATCRDYSRVSG